MPQLLIVDVSHKNQRQSIAWKPISYSRKEYRKNQRNCTFLIPLPYTPLSQRLIGIYACISMLNQTPRYSCGCYGIRHPSHLDGFIALRLVVALLPGAAAGPANGGSNLPGGGEVAPLR